MLVDYLSLVAKEVKHDPYNFEIDIEAAIDFKFKNLSDFIPPNGEILLRKKQTKAWGQLQ